MPLGLYRQSGLRDNKFPYVCTNPDPQTILSENDKIFVLAQNTPSELSKKLMIFLKKHYLILIKKALNGELLLRN